MPFIKLRKLPSMPSFCHDRILDFFFFKDKSCFVFEFYLFLVALDLHFCGPGFL